MESPRLHHKLSIDELPQGEKKVGVVRMDWMAYTPQRDHRFEYLWELMDFIEDTQCKSCAFRKSSDDTDTPMCYEVEGLILLEEEVSCLYDYGEKGVFCTKYRTEESYDPHQLELF